MKNTIPIGLLVLAVAAAPAWATGYTFNVTSGYWDDPNSWDPSTGYPQDGDSAIIGSGKTCNIRDDETCDWINVAGTLNIAADCSLTLGDSPQADSSVTGDLNLNGTSVDHEATLIIAYDLKITGDGGSIEMTHGRIKARPGNPTATLSLDLDEDCYHPIKLHGDGYIDVAMWQRAQVVADHNGAYLNLTENDKLGFFPAFESGWWIAESGGYLRVAADVIGSASWKLDGSGSKIVIDERCSVTGWVYLYDGRFIINDDEDSFCTTGYLYWHSIGDAPGTTVKIEVPAGTSARFNGCCLCKE